MVNINIWGREFSLEVKYDCYFGEEVTQCQKETFERFYYNPMWIEKAKRNVEMFCKKRVESDDENCQRDDIFSYIKPEYIFVKHDEKRPRIALMCKYRYDLEHGLAVVFDANGNVTVGIQDIIL